MEIVVVVVAFSYYYYLELLFFFQSGVFFVFCVSEMNNLFYSVWFFLFDSFGICALPFYFHIWDKAFFMALLSLFKNIFDLIHIRIFDIFCLLLFCNVKECFVCIISYMGYSCVVFYRAKRNCTDRFVDECYSL